MKTLFTRNLTFWQWLGDWWQILVVSFLALAMMVGAFCLLTPMAHASFIMRGVPLYVSGGPAVGTFTFGIVTNTTALAPAVVGSTLSNSLVQWIDPFGTTTNSKTPAASFFRKEGQYQLVIDPTNWPKVTYYTFAQSASMAFLTNISVSADVAGYMSSLTYMGFANNTNLVDYSGLVIPASVTSFTNSWYGGFQPSQVYPQIQHCTNVTTLKSAWDTCGYITNGSVSLPPVTNMIMVTNLAYAWNWNTSVKFGFPDVYTLTNVQDLSYAWYYAYALTGTFPVVSNLVQNKSLLATWEMNNPNLVSPSDLPYVNTMTNNTSLASTWYNLRKYTNSFPAVSAMTKVTSMNSAWRSASLAVDPIPDTTPLTNVTGTGLEYTWYGCRKITYFPPTQVSNMVGITSLANTFNDCRIATNMPSVYTLTNLTTMQGAWSFCVAMPYMPITNITMFPRLTTLLTWCNSSTNMQGTIALWTWSTNLTAYGSHNTRIRYTNVPACLSTNVRSALAFRMDNSLLPQDNVDQILVDFDTSGATNMTINVGGTTVGQSNCWASVTGSNAATSLRAKGCTVTGNGI